MKKLFLLLVIISFTFGMVFSQIITVTSPRAGDTWYKGTAYTITWTSSECADPNVKINIFRNSVVQANFVVQLTGPNSGSKSCPILDSYINGNYVIRVKTVDNICLGDSGLFTIANRPGEEPEPTRRRGRRPPPPPPSIRVISPSSGSDVYIGSNREIKWRSLSGTGGPTDRVSISAVNQAGSIILHITQHQPNNPGENTYNWQVLGAQFHNRQGQYKIRVRSEGGLSGESGLFDIAAREGTRGAPPPGVGTGGGYDFAIGPVHRSDIQLTRISHLRKGGPPNTDYYRIRINFRIRNNYGNMPTVPSIPCRWTHYVRYIEYNGEKVDYGWYTINNYRDYSGTFNLGPFPLTNSGEWTRCYAYFYVHLNESDRDYKKENYFSFELLPPAEFNDPNTANNTTRSVRFGDPE